jgi:hypothetical protein
MNSASGYANRNVNPDAGKAKTKVKKNQENLILFSHGYFTPGMFDTIEIHENT